MENTDHINLAARIDWRDGMPLTARTLTCMDQLHRRSEALANTLRAGNNIGLLPRTPFAARAAFVKKRLEIERLQLVALMPTGNVMHIDERVDMEVPMLLGDTYYLACGEGDKTVCFDDGEVSYVRPAHSFAFLTLDEVAQRGAFPVMKFNVDHGACVIDTNYIPPVLVASANEALMARRKELATLAAAMAQHENMPRGEAALAMARYGYILATPHDRLTTEELVHTVEQMTAAVDYHVLAPHADTPPVPLIPNLLDIAAWLDDVKARMEQAVTVLDNHPLEEPKIDIEALRKELYELLKGELHDELYQKLKQEIGDSLRTELTNELLQKLMDYINTRLKNDLHAILSGELADSLYKQLYDSLYKALYDELYVPPQEVDDSFTPLI